MRLDKEAYDLLEHLHNIGHLKSTENNQITEKQVAGTQNAANYLDEECNELQKSKPLTYLS